jgi:NADP-dependent 3-hydroxy acid dehydrogenase YdfG
MVGFVKIIITGNKNAGLAAELYKCYPDALFASRTTGFDLTSHLGQNRLADLILEYDIFINCAALWKFNQTVLLETIYKVCMTANHNIHIINVGSTTDRVKNGKAWLYNAEKKALRDYSNTLGIAGVWDKGPKVSYISFGTLSNNQNKHPERRTMNIDKAAQYIKWIIDQPKELNINEISIDPVQNTRWYNE